MGLMQIMPGTWRFERARLGLGNDPFDGRDNIMAGADYLSAMRQRYGPVGMLAAYNAGPGRYEDFRQRGRSEEHTSELQSLMRISYAVFCLKKKKYIHEQKLHDICTTKQTIQQDTSMTKSHQTS